MMRIQFALLPALLPVFLMFSAAPFPASVRRAEFNQQKPAAPATKPASSTTQKKETPAWPKLDSTRATELGKVVAELKRSSDPDEQAHYVDKVAEYGKSAIPLLYESLLRQKAMPVDEMQEETKRVLLALERLPTKDDGPVLAVDCLHRHIYVRRFALRKCAEFAITEALPAAQKSLLDKDEAIQFEAALCVTALGSIDGFDILLKSSREQWPLVGTRIRKVTERARSEKATEKCLPGLGSKDWQEVCASLRLLAGWGTKDCARSVGNHLGSTDHRIKEDAINALRGIMDNEPPLEKLSAFDLAEQARAWSKRI